MHCKVSIYIFIIFHQNVIHVLPQEIKLGDVWRTCNKIRAAIFRVGLNLWEYYLPLDPGKNCLISGMKLHNYLNHALSQNITRRFYNFRDCFREKSYSRKFNDLQKFKNIRNIGHAYKKVADVGVGYSSQYSNKNIKK